MITHTICIIHLDESWTTAFTLFFMLRKSYDLNSCKHNTLSTLYESCDANHFHLKWQILFGKNINIDLILNPQDNWN